MKKFVFSLASLMKVRENAKERLTVEYAEAENALNAALKKKKYLENSHALLCMEYENQAAGGVKPADIHAVKVYLEELQTQIKAAAIEAKQAKIKAENKRLELAEVYKEIKALEKLREKQYREYLAEAEKQEVKIREDILAFNVTGGSNSGTGGIQ
jgi:flagellar FliJ protein